MRHDRHLQPKYEQMDFKLGPSEEAICDTDHSTLGSFKLTLSLRVSAFVHIGI